MITNSLSKTKKELSIKPYYTDSHCTIYQGDCLDIMAIFPDESIDLIITDPPYNVSHKDKLYRTYKNGKRKDISLDFGEWDYGFDATLFLEESKRVLKKYGQWLIFCSDLQLGDYVEWLKENGYFKQILIWEKLNPPPHFRKTEYRQATEFIVWAYKENPSIKEQHFNFLTQEEMKNIFRFPICQGNERTEHPTQKPVKLVVELLKRHSFDSDVVLDPFMGSGTTLVAGKMLGIKVIGIEINDRYCKISTERLKQEVLF